MATPRKPRKERVEIKCPVRTDGAIKNKELPFRMLVMAPLSGQPNPPLRKPQLVSTVGPNDLNSLIKKVQPTLKIDVRSTVKSKPVGAGVESTNEDDKRPLTLQIKSMNSFTRDGLESTLSELMPEFKDRLKSLQKFRNFRAQMDNNVELQDIDRDLADSELLEVLARSQSSKGPADE